MKPKTLERPRIPVDFITQAIRECGLDELFKSLYFGNSTNPMLVKLTEVAIWANELQAHFEKHNGKVEKEVNETIVEKTLWAFDVMRELEIL